LVRNLYLNRMKKIGLFAMLILLVIACNEEKKTEFVAFGKELSADKFLSKEEMTSKFENLKSGDTLDVKFASKINSVCKAKGCWMKLDLANDKESMVKFKDYGFFVPLNSANREVIVNGKAYVTEVSVQELQHYAKDAGKSEEEVAKIVTPEYTYAFIAEGVLMKNENE